MKKVLDGAVSDKDWTKRIGESIKELKDETSPTVEHSKNETEKKMKNDIEIEVIYDQGIINDITSGMNPN